MGFLNQKGQTSLEYLMLLALTFALAYLLATLMGPFTRNLIAGMKAGLFNVIQNGQLTPDSITSPQTSGHPSDPTRMRPLHL